MPGSPGDLLWAIPPQSGQLDPGRPWAVRGALPVPPRHQQPRDAAGSSEWERTGLGWQLGGEHQAHPRTVSTARSVLGASGCGRQPPVLPPARAWAPSPAAAQH
ncbi:cytochrome P450 2J2-like [Platysternon megacephalum]|uniref:Cytochrome P450 2J2-like n=1 Tax=Platysternon megacephalum TaxID=55544 RepID=A0A4D9DTA9_9SAUR|nr:cytochrome P450 2J2-like [Platysternon megacephalum]